ncbi:hypothetical protein Ae201684P_009370 [Aphanomyces euteiches]|nr:hypothetical protein Ae201684P_009370 [Aphanomyces euteiches]
MQHLTLPVESEIASKLPQCFGICFDGSDGTIHYKAIFASFQRLGKKKTPLLAMAPLLDDNRLDAPAHVNFICETLKITNGAIARLCGVPLVGCYAHKFNLAVKRWLLPFEDDLTLINDLMGHLKRLHVMRELRQLTDLAPVRGNMTRWSSTFNMVSRFLELVPALDQMESINEFMLSRAQV